MKFSPCYQDNFLKLTAAFLIDFKIDLITKSKSFCNVIQVDIFALLYFGEWSSKIMSMIEMR